MYKAVTVFDLDNTLLNDDKDIFPENITALTQLRQNNILPVIATGRDRFEVQDVVTSGHFDAIVSANGADINYREMQLAEDAISPNNLKVIAEWAKRNDTCIAFSNHEGIAINRINELVRTNYTRIHRDTPTIDPTYYSGRSITKGLVFLGQDASGLALEEDLRQRFADLTFYRDSDVCMDIVAKGTTKAVGVRHLIQDLNLTSIPIYAFGDGHNDIAMLEAATVGVAMGNADADVQAHANYVTDKYNQGGIVNALKHFELI